MFLIGRLLDQHPLYSRNNNGEKVTDELREYLKQLEGQHWLELIDRYVSFPTGAPKRRCWALICDTLR